jgi:hypothetical protein
MRAASRIGQADQGGVGGQLADLTQHFSGGGERCCKPVKDQESLRQNRDKIAATAAVQRRCWRVC